MRPQGAPQARYFSMRVNSAVGSPAPWGMRPELIIELTLESEAFTLAWVPYWPLCWWQLRQYVLKKFAP